MSSGHRGRGFDSAPQFGIGFLWRWIREAFSTGYQPERHYMRGAGPKSAVRVSLRQKLGAKSDRIRERPRSDGRYSSSGPDGPVPRPPLPP